jgi:hypothetical protein
MKNQQREQWDQLCEMAEKAGLPTPILTPGFLEGWWRISLGKTTLSANGLESAIHRVYTWILGHIAGENRGLMAGTKYEELS